MMARDASEKITIVIVINPELDINVCAVNLMAMIVISLKTTIVNLLVALQERTMYPCLGT